MRDMAPADARDILSASRLGVLSLAHEGQGYGIPLFYGYDGHDVYFHCHPGLKDEYMDTQEACLVVIHVESDHIWESVQVFGTLERLSINTDIEAAQSALFKIPFPPAVGHGPSGNPIRSDQGVYYVRLRPTRIAGKASAPKEMI